MTGVLLKAVTAGRPRQVRLLLDSGIHLETTDDCGQTALIRAVFLEQKSIREKIVKMLLKAGVKVTSCDVVARTALSWACIYSRDREIGWMLQFADVELNLNQMDVNGQTALAHASITGNAATVKLLVDALMKYGMSVELPDKKGMTPLMHAIKLRHDICASILLHQGAATVGKEMKSPEDVDHAINFWENGCSDVHERTRLFLDRDYDLDSNNNVNEKTKSRLKPLSMMCPPNRGLSGSYFPPILSKSCAHTIKYREACAKRFQIHTPPESDEEDALSEYGSEVSSSSDDFLDNCAEITTRGGCIGLNKGINRDWTAGTSMSVLTCQSPISYRTVSMTSSTEANVVSSDDDDVDDRSRPVRVDTRVFQPTRDMHRMYRVYEKQKSPSYRPGAARPVVRPKVEEGSSDSYVESSSDYGDSSKDHIHNNAKKSGQTVVVSSRRVSSKRPQHKTKTTVTKRPVDVNSSSDSDLSEKLFTPAKRSILPKITANRAI